MHCWTNCRCSDWLEIVVEKLEWMPVTIMGDLDGVASVAVALLMVWEAYHGFNG